MNQEDRDFLYARIRDDKARLASWIALYGVRESKGLMCAHGLQNKRKCPGRPERAGNCAPYDAFDHETMWREKDGTKFILTQPYNQPVQALIAYGEKHKLRMTFDWPEDNWHHPATNGYRLYLA